MIKFKNAHELCKNTLTVSDEDGKLHICVKNEASGKENLAVLTRYQARRLLKDKAVKHIKVRHSNKAVIPNNESPNIVLRAEDWLHFIEVLRQFAEKKSEWYTVIREREFDDSCLMKIKYQKDGKVTFQLSFDRKRITETLLPGDWMEYLFLITPRVQVDLPDDRDNWELISTGMHGRCIRHWDSVQELHLYQYYPEDKVEDLTKWTKEQFKKMVTFNKADEPHGNAGLSASYSLDERMFYLSTTYHGGERLIPVSSTKMGRILRAIARKPALSVSFGTGPEQIVVEAGGESVDIGKWCVMTTTESFKAFTDWAQSICDFYTR